MFRNADITYARDSTLIITLAKLRELMVKDLFEILNIFYQNNHIKKLIYKKEFLIIHFTSRYSLKVLCDKTYYMYIDYYFFFKDKGLECYLNPIISIQNIKEEVDLVFNEKYVSRYSDLIKVKDGFVFYDKYKNDILYTELLQNSQMQFSKPKKLLSFSSVENISVSSDYKYLAIDYYDKNKTLPKLKTKIYDLETKKLFSVSEEGISDSVILSWEGNHYLATVKVVSQFISTKIYKIEKDEEGNIKNINFVNEFDKEFGKNKFSLSDGGNGNLLFLYKDGLDFSIKLYNINTKKQKEIKMLSEDTVLQDISCFDNKIYFSYTQKGTMPRLGIIDLNNFDVNNSKEREKI